MKTSKEFFERLQNDTAFAEEVGAKIVEKTKAGEQDYKKVWIPLAAEYGYELSGEELDERYEAATAEMSEEELGKVSGGSTPGCVLIIGSGVWASLIGATYVTNKLAESIKC